MNRGRRNSGPAPVQTSRFVPRPVPEWFTQAVLRGPRADKFELLCKRGCLSADLVKLIFAAVKLDRHVSGTAGKRVLGNIAQIRASELKKLPRDLRDLAQRVENLNKAFLPQLQALALDGSIPTPKWPLIIYASLPSTMRDFAESLRALPNVRREILQGYDQPDDWVLLLLLSYVKSTTGRPNYSAVSSLLQQAFRIIVSHAQPNIDRIVIPPRFCSTTALRKFDKRAPADLRASLITSDR